MSKVTNINSRVTLDLGVHNWTQPPCIIPLSKRGEDFLKLGEGVEAVIHRSPNPPELPDGFRIADVTEHLEAPFKVIIREI